METENASATRLKPAHLPITLRPYKHVFDLSYTSAKLATALSLLRTIRARGEKTLVFAHFRWTMDVLHHALIRERIGCAQYHGDLSSSERTAVLDRVRTDAGCTVLIMSILAGGVGLNITSCNHVLVLEPWWNPYVEDQAIARAHRIGQTKPVQVYKLVGEDCVEGRMTATQERKRAEVGSMMGRASAGVARR
ncbi:P-loop containing nucleoside triphosphate hydrolase protein [Amylostereum chailletii]|nr:P-loop containing nucleoside triphosphate hydrolase protein [Amylostereum chailletii]